MNKYKILHFGHCYLNSEGDFVIGLLSGNKKHGYTFAASHAHPYSVALGKLHVDSRVVPNDGHWIEVSPEAFNLVSQCHSGGYKVKPPDKAGGRAVISKY